MVAVSPACRFLFRDSWDCLRHSLGARPLLLWYAHGIGCILHPARLCACLCPRQRPTRRQTPLPVLDGVGARSHLREVVCDAVVESYREAEAGNLLILHLAVNRS